MNLMTELRLNLIQEEVKKFPGQRQEDSGLSKLKLENNNNLFDLKLKKIISLNHLEIDVPDTIYTKL